MSCHKIVSVSPKNQRRTNQLATSTHRYRYIGKRGSGRWGRVKVEGQTCRNWFLWSLSLFDLSLKIVNLQETSYLQAALIHGQFVEMFNPAQPHLSAHLWPWAADLEHHMLCALRGSYAQLPVGKKIERAGISKLSTVCPTVTSTTWYHMALLASWSVRRVTWGDKVRRRFLRVARMVFTVSQNDWAANWPKIRYAVSCSIWKTSEYHRIPMKVRGHMNLWYTMYT